MHANTIDPCSTTKEAGIRVAWCQGTRGGGKSAWYILVLYAHALNRLIFHGSYKSRFHVDVRISYILILMQWLAVPTKLSRLTSPAHKVGRDGSWATFAYAQA